MLPWLSKVRVSFAWSLFTLATIVRVKAENLGTMLSTGASLGTTGGTYDRLTDIVTFTQTTGTTYTGVSFGDALCPSHLVLGHRFIAVCSL